MDKLIIKLHTPSTAEPTQLTRSDLRDARCSECGARCIPGQTHPEHNLGWRKKVLSCDWYDLCLHKPMYPGWDLVAIGGGYDPEPPSVELHLRNKVDKSSDDICKEFDDIATGRFYQKEWVDGGGWSVAEGEVYHAKWWFEKREDAYLFARTYLNKL